MKSTRLRDPSPGKSGLREIYSPFEDETRLPVIQTTQTMK